MTRGQKIGARLQKPTDCGDRDGGDARLTQASEWTRNDQRSSSVLAQTRVIGLLYKKPRFSQGDFYAAQNATPESCPILVDNLRPLRLTARRRLIQFDLN